MKYIYRECGGIWLVNVLSDSTSQLKQGLMRTVVLQCIETIRMPINVPNIEDNHTWKVEAVQGYEAYVGWHLSPANKPGYI
jgi:hypothetical protein